MQGSGMPDKTAAAAIFRREPSSVPISEKAADKISGFPDNSSACSILPSRALLMMHPSFQTAARPARSMFQFSSSAALEISSNPWLYARIMDSRSAFSISSVRSPGASFELYFRCAAPYVLSSFFVENIRAIWAS